MKRTGNWGKAARKIIEKDDYIHSLERDGYWDRGE